MKTQFEIWLDRVNLQFDGVVYSWKPLTFKKGSKFIKIQSGSSVWGFVCMYDGYFQGLPVKKGDLMKAASWRAPAKHSRGNIFDGTAKYKWTGPEYL
jgi:hypothetical protein